ncbi:MAG: class I SAM-dependent methyltransferase [Rhodospirillales bacterium]|nr:class I SAM-dependent methyltransferase [Rhodospirillales bacterium]
MTALDFPDEHFDAVISVFSIFFVEDMEKQVAELWRMVRPGGNLRSPAGGQEYLSQLSQHGGRLKGGNALIYIQGIIPGTKLLIQIFCCSCLPTGAS